MIDTRRFTHDCDNCLFHGHMQGYDVYTCASSLVLRRGNEGGDYQSLPLEMVAEVMVRPHGALWSAAVDVVAASISEQVFLKLEVTIPRGMDEAFRIKSARIGRI